MMFLCDFWFVLFECFISIPGGVFLFYHINLLSTPDFALVDHNHHDVQASDPRLFLTYLEEAYGRFSV